jgi:Secretion system C-terminal sorting domain
MKRSLSLIIFLTCIGLCLRAQVNYVLNPSFELQSACPGATNEIQLATYWQQLDSVPYSGSSVNSFWASNPVLCSPDYCHTCSGTYAIHVPNSEFFYHYPRTGNGMISENMYFDEVATTGEYSKYYREYTQGHLYKPLTAGKSYCVTFFVSVEQVSGYVINHIGALLDDGSIDSMQDSVGCARPQTTDTPQVVEESIIADTNGWSTMSLYYYTSAEMLGDSSLYDSSWVKIQGSFTATGTERFIAIGNFSDKAHTTAYLLPSNPFGGFKPGGDWAYYFIDDVSVIESDNIPFAGNDTTIAPGDSVFLGPHEIALPYTWYKLGDTVAIDSGGGIWVRPDSTTTYVLEQNLCGIYTYDTVMVQIKGLGVGTVSLAGSIDVYPNPAHDAITVEGATSGTAIISNLLGQELFRAAINSKKQLLDIAQLATGTYLLQIVADDGSRQSMLLQKD